MKRVLVIWNEIPEESCFLIFTFVNDHDFLFLQGCHDKYINSTDIDDTEQQELNDFFFQKDGKFKFEKIKTPLSGQFDAIVITGMFS